MNNIVYYLSFYSEQAGFLFPDELPENYYSPGLFLLEAEDDGKLSYRYSLDAIDNGTRISLELVRMNEGNQNSTLYMVKTKHYGTFFFNLEKINPEFRYLGKKKKLLNHNSLVVAIMTDSNKLERVCQKYNFYFIGSTLLKNDF